MKKSTKAVLLSALVFPGAGHLYLEKYFTAVVLAGISFAVIIYIMIQVIERAVTIAEQIQNSDVLPDIQEITVLVLNQSNGTDVQILNITTIVFIICWIIGIVDSYRIACVKNKNNDGLLDR